MTSANCREEVFDPRRYDGTSVSVEHADGLIEELGRLCRSQSTSWAQPPVKTKSLTDPPDEPEDGDRYLIPAGATDYWEGFGDYIAEYSEVLLQWRVLAPREGMLTYVEDENEYYSYDGADWTPLSEAHTHPNLPTADEKAALVGTSGDPSATNRYVTDADPRLLGVAGSGPMTATLYVVIPDDGLSVFPTVHEIPTDADADSNSEWRVMHRKRWTMASSIEAMSVGVFLKVKARADAGAGQLRWMISTAEEVLGTPPSGDAVDLLETPFNLTIEEKKYEVAGLAPVASLPTGPFELLLVGKPSLSGEKVLAKILSDSSLELGY